MALTSLRTNKTQFPLCLQVRQREARNPRFAFLQPWHLAHPQYRAALAATLGSVTAVDLMLAESAALVAGGQKLTAGPPPTEHVAGGEGTAPKATKPAQVPKVLAIRANPSLAAPSSTLPASVLVAQSVAEALTRGAALAAAGGGGVSSAPAPVAGTNNTLANAVQQVRCTVLKFTF